MKFRFVDPVADVIEARTVRNVVHDYGACRVAVVGAGYGSAQTVEAGFGRTIKPVA